MTGLAHRFRSLRGQSVLAVVSTGASQLAILLVYLFAARGAGPAEFGQAVAAIALGVSFAGFLDFGANALWVREIARGTLGMTELGSRSRAKFVAAVVIALVWAALCVWVFSDGMLLVATPILLVTIVSDLARVPLKGIARADLVAVLIVIDRSTVVCSFLVLQSIGVDSIDALWVALLMGPIVSASVAIPLTPRGHRPFYASFSLSNP